MHLKYYLSILWGNKWIIVATLGISISIAVIATMMITPVYSAVATFRVASASSGSVSSGDSAYSDRLMNTYTKIATSRPVLDKLASELNLQALPEVKVAAISSTELIQILVRSADPLEAQKAANRLADILITESQDLYSGGNKSTTEILAEQLAIAEAERNRARTDYETLVATTPDDNNSITEVGLMIDLKEKTYQTLLGQFEAARVKEAVKANAITLIDPAVIPVKPSQPNVIMNISLGIIGGLAGGIALVFLSENLNPHLFTMEQIESVTELDTIEKIPAISYKGLLGAYKKTPQVNDTGFKGSFQKLQAKISQLNANGHRVKTLLFTSAVPGEGKSTIVANLGMAIGKAGQKVIVVDCDMRLPTQHKIFELPNKTGLSTVLTQQTRFYDAIQKNRNPNTWILTSGPVAINAMELLGSPQMKSLIEILSQKFDYVLLDTPALLPVGDALALSPFTDGIVLITRQGRCKEEELRDAYKQLADFNKKIIGVVVNDVHRANSSYYSKYRYT